MSRLSPLLVLLILALGLAGCAQLGALTPRAATRQALQSSGKDQASAQILGDYRLPDGKSMVVFSFTPEAEAVKPMTALGYSLLERNRIGLWREVNRGTYTKEALDLASEPVDYEIANQPDEVAAVFGRVLSPQVSEVVAIYDDQHQSSDRKLKDGFAFFPKQGAYPVELRVVGKDGIVLKTIELELMESVAMETLTQFFSYLHDGMYAEASHVYGGSYQELADMNNLIDPLDHTALWQNACKVNGFQCLYVGSIGPKGKNVPPEFNFLVGFMDDEGNTFQQEACCGETSATPQTEFEFRVKKMEGGQFKVLDLPVYIP